MKIISPATSPDLTPNGGLTGGNFLFQGNQKMVKYDSISGQIKNTYQNIPGFSAEKCWKFLISNWWFGARWFGYERDSRNERVGVTYSSVPRFEGPQTTINPKPPNPNPTSFTVYTLYQKWVFLGSQSIRFQKGSFLKGGKVFYSSVPLYKAGKGKKGKQQIEAAQREADGADSGMSGEQVTWTPWLVGFQHDVVDKIGIEYTTGSNWLAFEGITLYGDYITLGIMTLGLRGL